MLAYSSHYRWVSLCPIWKWRTSWQVRKAGQSRFAWCRGQTQEASLVPMQFKNWLFLSQSTPRPHCGRENREREVGFLYTTVRFLSSNIQAQTQATGQPQRAGTDHINSSPKPSFPLWRLPWHEQFLIWHIYFSVIWIAREFWALQTHTANKQKYLSGGREG